MTLGGSFGAEATPLASWGQHSRPRPKLTIQLGLAVVLLAEGPVAGLGARPNLDQVAGSSLQSLQLRPVF